jgi:hypothetical protein
MAAKTIFLCLACGKDKPKIKGVQPISERGVAYPRPGAPAGYTRLSICYACWARGVFGDAWVAHLETLGMLPDN